MQKLLGKMRRAIVDFNLIQYDDSIALGLSGGKDSIALLHLLKLYQRFSPEKFHLTAITVDTGAGADYSKLKDLCTKLNVPYHIEYTNITKVVFEIREEKNPCSLCANIRRGALNTAAKRLGCNKIALAHHKNDAIETLLMSMFYEGRISCFSPKTYLSKTELTMIRPLIYVDENEIIEASKKYSFPIVKNPCPANGFTKREYIKQFTYSLEKEIPDFKNNIFHSLINTKQLNIWEKENNI